MKRHISSSEPVYTTRWHPLCSLVIAFKRKHVDASGTSLERASQNGIRARCGRGKVIRILEQLSQAPGGFGFAAGQDPFAAGYRRGFARTGTVDQRGASYPHYDRPARCGSGLRFSQRSCHGDVAQRRPLSEDCGRRQALAGLARPAKCSPRSGGFGRRLLASRSRSETVCRSKSLHGRPTKTVAGADG